MARQKNVFVLLSVFYIIIKKKCL